MATLHLLTPLDPCRSDFFDAAAASVDALRQTLDTCRVEWWLGLDGVRASQKVLARAKASGAHCLGLPKSGVTKTRSALIREITATSGEDSWLAPFDADDELVPQGWQEVWDSWERDIGWVGLNREYVGVTRSPRQSFVTENQDFASGELPWERPLAFHPNSILVRSSLAARVPYPENLNYHEDLAWALALSSYAPGTIRTPITLHYRTWAGQLVQEEEYSNKRARALRAQRMEDYINGHRRSLGLPGVSVPMGWV